MMRTVVTRTSESESWDPRHDRVGTHRYRGRRVAASASWWASATALRGLSFSVEGGSWLRRASLLLAGLATLAVAAYGQVIFDNRPWGSSGAYETAFQGDPAFDSETGELIPNFRYRWLQQSFTTPGFATTTREIEVTIRADPHGAAYGVPIVLSTVEGTFMNYVDLVGGAGDYTFALVAGSPATLAANTRYYLTVMSDPFIGYTLDWFYADADTAEVAGFQGEDDSGYHEGEYPGDFSLRIAVVPEPGQFAWLGGLGLLGWATVRRRRRSASSPQRPRAAGRE